MDCRSGMPFDLVAMPEGAPIMRLPPFNVILPLVTIQPDGAEGAGTLPSSLVTLPPIPATLPAISQDLVMNMFRDKEGMAPLMKAGLGMGGENAMGMEKVSATGAMSLLGNTDSVVARVTRLIEDQPELSQAAQLSANGVNGKPYALDEPGFAAKRETVLRWRISEGDDAMPHPVHVHGCQFRIVSESGKPLQAYRAGWKDIAPIFGGGFSEILVSFPHRAGVQAPFVAHCHILEHEDSGMMTQFTVA